jgi:hypothetical protein
MYVRLCTVRFANLGRIHALLRNYGLLPLTRSLSASPPTASHDKYYSIELPVEDIKRGRKILAASKVEKDLV